MDRFSTRVDTNLPLGHPRVTLGTNQILLQVDTNLPLGHSRVTLVTKAILRQVETNLPLSHPRVTNVLGFRVILIQRNSW